MTYLINFGVTFIIIYLLYFLLVINRKRKLNKYLDGQEVTFFLNISRLKKEDIKNPKGLAHLLALTNAFILSIGFNIIYVIKNNILKILIGFISVTIITFLAYKIIAIIYKRKKE